MNKERRKKIDEAMNILEGLADALNNARDLIREAGEEEQEAFDNLSENLQGAERGQTMEQAASELSEIADALEEIDISDLVTRLDEAKQ
jgi:uncharacterized protein YukE